jgi:hypothetical protein
MSPRNEWVLGWDSLLDFEDLTPCISLSKKTR